MSDEHIFDYSELVEPNGEVLSQEIITYIKRNGKITKISVSRIFAGNTNYTDSMTSEVIYAGEL